MRSFACKAIALAALVCVPLVGVFLLPLPYDHDLAPLLDKVRLLRDERRGRIVLVGGSGLLLGVDSGEMERRLNRPVVNLGLYAGLGITSLLDEASPLLRPGDIVIISPEYSVMFDHHHEVTRRWLYALDPVRKLLPLYGPEQGAVKAFVSDLNGLIRAKFKALPEAVRQAVRTGNATPLRHYGYVHYEAYFNRSGDSLRELRPAGRPEQLDQYGMDCFTGRGYEQQPLDAVNRHFRELKGRGIFPFFVFPVYPLAEYDRQGASMKRYEQRLRKELACRVLGTPQDFLYPYALFTDTVHHVNPEGRRKRTARLITLLERELTGAGRMAAYGQRARP